MTQTAVQPMDEFNQVLISNVHPSDWVNPEPVDRYNLVVIGAGTAGLVTAAGAAGLGAQVALVEKHLLGGDCLNVGCVPSKCLIRSAQAYTDVRDAGEFGVRAPRGTQVDFSAVMQRMRRLRSQISHHDSAPALPEPWHRRLARRRPVHRARCRRGRRETAAFSEGRAGHRGPSRSTSHPGSGGSGISDQWDGVFAHRVAQTPGRHRRRSDRM